MVRRSTCDSRTWKHSAMIETGQIRQWRLDDENWDLKDQLQGKVFLVLEPEPREESRISVPAWYCLMDGAREWNYEFFIENNSVVLT
jgi:hypothetical protein